MKYEISTNQSEEKIHQLTEDYKMRRLAGENPNIEEYMDAFPEVGPQISEEIDAWEFLEETKGTWKLLNSRPPLAERLTQLHRRMDEIDRLINQRKPCLDSLFDSFLDMLGREAEPVGTFAAETPFEVDELRKYYNENFIRLTLTQVHVTIETDSDHIILRFIGQTDLNEVEAVIYRLDDETEDKESIARKIKGNEVRFALSELGLTIRELNQVAFRLKIGDNQVEGRL